MRRLTPALLTPFALCSCQTVGTPAAAPMDVGGRVDHVLVSLPTPHFEAIDAYFADRFGEAWLPREDAGKGFLACRGESAYIEVWDAGRVEWPWPIGSQVAIITEDISRGAKIAEAHYGTPGRSWEAMDAPNLFTVCERDLADPVGGTFFVSYGEDWSPPTVPSSPVLKLDEVVTVVPDSRMDLADGYRVFGFAEVQTAEGPIFTGEYDVRVRLIARDFFDIDAPGHALLRFRLAEPVEQRNETEIDESGVLRAIEEGDTLTLVLTPDGAAMLSAD